ncbi:hypothetical protein NSERUTF1_1527 [Nocardia seriolae]|nr:hypothetical protein NSERUTF1_1527 [Nocardia seriolae]
MGFHVGLDQGERAGEMRLGVVLAAERVEHGDGSGLDFLGEFVASDECGHGISFPSTKICACARYYLRARARNWL